MRALLAPLYKLSILLLIGVSFNSCTKTVSTVAIKDVAVWNMAAHNAFTDLIKYNGSYYCTFREGSKHDSFDGKLRVIKSEDGKIWTSVASLYLKDKDLRDPHFFVDNTNNLCIATNARDTREARQNVIYKLKAGQFVLNEKVTTDNDYWLWSFTKHKNVLYSIGYNMKQSCFSSLNSSKPKINFFTNKDADFTDFGAFTTVNFTDNNFACPCETSIVFVNDTTLVAVVRDEHTPGASHIGYSKKPFQLWHWQDVPFFVRGPKLTMLPNGKIFIAAASMGYYDRTYFAILNPENFTIEKIQALPSDGDTGYPGVVIEGNTALISYYSSHEGNARVYIGRITY